MVDIGIRDRNLGFITLILIGKVPGISVIPTPKGFYVVEVDFPNGMETNYGKMLPISRQMQGKTNIITKDLRLVKRFFMPVKKTLKDQR